MRLCCYPVLIITCFTCLGAIPGQAIKASIHPAYNSIYIAQNSNSPDKTTRSILQPGTQGDDVKVLQLQLKELGYYTGEADGLYGGTTIAAVSKFQQAKGLVADGIAGSKTRESITTAIVAKKAAQTTANAQQTKQQKSQEQRGLLWWLLATLGFLGSIGALLYIIRAFNLKKSSKLINPTKAIAESDYSQQDSSLPLANIEVNGNGHSHNPTVIDSEEKIVPSTANLLPPEKTSRLAKVNIIDELMKDLRSHDPNLRRKAIWDLGQQGDSRAIQPLVDLLIDADSQQRSLILAALAEIGSRALKPMNRALAISLQDESPEVRQNAIRDLTRIYDMMAQISQMLSHALDDPDLEVQKTAQYALSQMNRIRTLSGQEETSEDFSRDN